MDLKIKLILFAFLTMPAVILSQTEVKSYNFSSFSDTSRNITEELLKLTPDEFESHPEFGQLPYNAPCKNCYELIHKRTDTTKMYVEAGSHGKHYYSQATLGLVHYEKNGQTMTYDPRLRKYGNGLYKSEKQDTPTFINVNESNTGFEIDGEKFKFNNVKLQLIKSDGSVINLGLADWSNYDVGEEGIKIYEAWEGIDIEIKFDLDRIKTNYIIEQPLSYLTDVQFLKISDELILPENFTIEEGEEVQSSSGNLFKGEYLIKNQNGEEVFKFKTAFGFDKSGDKSRFPAFPYKLDDNELSIIVPKNWLSSPDAVYPLVIDPLVQSTATQTAGWMSFYYNGAWCGGAGACAYNLTVPRPNNSTITGTLLSAQYITETGYCAGCWMTEAGFKVFSPCGQSPTPVNSFWSCNFNNPGTCTLTNQDVFSEIGSCLGSACSGNVVFQIQNSYCYCSTGGNCGVNCQWMPNNTWSITLQGHTVETLGDQITGSGSTTLVPASCTGSVLLDPNVQNGVPGYSYSWSIGGTSSTQTVDPYVYNGQSIVATVTDACGVVETATFSINCPLSQGLSSFSAERWDENVKTSWSMDNEQGVSQYEIYKSTDGENFKKIGEQNPQPNKSNYQFIDKRPYQGVSYYKLGTRIDGELFYSEVVSVLFEGNYSIQVIPNPVIEKFKVQFNGFDDRKSIINISDIKGNLVHSEKISIIKGINEKYLTTNLKKGLYILTIDNGSQVLKTRFIQQ